MTDPIRQALAARGERESAFIERLGRATVEQSGTDGGRDLLHEGVHGGEYQESSVSTQPDDIGTPQWAERVAAEYHSKQYGETLAGLSPDEAARKAAGSPPVEALKSGAMPASGWRDPDGTGDFIRDAFNDARNL